MNILIIFRKNYRDFNVEIPKKHLKKKCLRKYKKMKINLLSNDDENKNNEGDCNVCYI